MQRSEGVLNEQLVKNVKLSQFMRFIKVNRDRLSNGEVLNILVNDGYLVIYNEYNSLTKETKTVTLINNFDVKLDLNITDLANT